MPNCLNPRLLVVFTRQLEILVTVLGSLMLRLYGRLTRCFQFSLSLVCDIRNREISSDLEMIMHVFIFLLRKPFFKVKRKSLSLHFCLNISVLTIIINQLLTTVSAKRVTAGNKWKVYVSYP